ncbi:hypothetical protein Hanom_Chr07g00614281 [Helianthus anomalus]
MVIFKWELKQMSGMSPPGGGKMIQTSRYCKGHLCRIWSIDSYCAHTTSNPKCSISRPKG